jgi:hypothetical protein
VSGSMQGAGRKAGKEIVGDGVCRGDLVIGVPLGCGPG